MAFVKNFCRIVTEHELSDEDVIDFFDIVQSVVPTKILTGFSGTGDVVSVDVVAYTDQSQYIYEIILKEDIDPEDGDAIAAELANEFEFDFDFEASVEA
jgi:hypothetical protein